MKLKSGLRMMGSSMAAYNLSWFIITLIQTFISLIITTSLLYVTKILYYTDFSLFIFAYSFYFLSMLPLAQIGSNLFKEPKLASFLCNLFILVSILLWYILKVINQETKDFPQW